MPISASVPASLAAAVRQTAEDAGQSVSQMIETLLADCFMAGDLHATGTLRGPETPPNEREAIPGPELPTGGYDATRGEYGA